jgi:hypothetical protein
MDRCQLANHKEISEEVTKLRKTMWNLKGHEMKAILEFIEEKPLQMYNLQYVTSFCRSIKMCRN